MSKKRTVRARGIRSPFYFSGLIPLFSPIIPWAGGYDIWRTTDNGANWAKVPGSALRIAVDPSGVPPVGGDEQGLTRVELETHTLDSIEQRDFSRSGSTASVTCDLLISRPPAGT